MTISLATKDDRDRLVLMYHKMMLELVPFGYGIEATTENAVNLVDKLFESWNPLVIAENGQKLVGFLFWCAPKLSPRSAVGHGRYVLPEYRRQGVCKAMIAKAMEELRKMGTVRIEVGVLAGNAPGIAGLKGTQHFLLANVYEVKV